MEKTRLSRGIEFFVDDAFIESFEMKTPFPLDAYDRGICYAVTPLSEAALHAADRRRTFPILLVENGRIEARLWQKS